MEKILSKELLLQNLNSTDSFVAKNSLTSIFDELLKGDKGLVKIQDIIFSQGSNYTAGEFFKQLSMYFLQKEQENMQEWDNFFNILEQRPDYLQVFRLLVLDIYLKKGLPKPVGRRCYFWLNDHCQIGEHETFILKLLSHPENNALMLLANRYCQQDYRPSIEVLKTICSLPLRLSRKLEAYSFFMKQSDPVFSSIIIKNIINDVNKSDFKATAEEKKQIWSMVVDLLYRVNLNEIRLEINLDLFKDLFSKNKIGSQIYINILDAFAEQVTWEKDIKEILLGYTQIVVLQKQEEYLPRVKNVLFALLESKKAWSNDIIRSLLDIVTLWKDEMWFKTGYLAEITAVIKKHFWSVEETDISVLSRSINIDKRMFLMLLGKSKKDEIPMLLEMVAYKYPEIWTEFWEKLMWYQGLDLEQLLVIVVELYKNNPQEQILQSIQSILNNLPEKEKFVSEAEQKLAMMQDNPRLKELAENYLKAARENMVEYMIG